MLYLLGLYIIGGLDYWTDRFSFKNARRCSIILPLWLISMLGNTIFDATPAGCQLFNMCDDLYHVILKRSEV